MKFIYELLKENGYLPISEQDDLASKKGKHMEQTLEVQATISVLIPEDKILVDKVEYQELKEKDFDGWVGMDVFIKKSNRSRTTIKNLLNRPEMVKSYP